MHLHKYRVNNNNNKHDVPSFFPLCGQMTRRSLPFSKALQSSLSQCTSMLSGEPTISAAITSSWRDTVVLFPTTIINIYNTSKLPSGSSDWCFQFPLRWEKEQSFLSPVPLTETNWNLFLSEHKWHIWWKPWMPFLCLIWLFSLCCHSTKAVTKIHQSSAFNPHTHTHATPNQSHREGMLNRFFDPRW